MFLFRFVNLLASVLRHPRNTSSKPAEIPAPKGAHASNICFGGAIKAAAGLEKIALNANDIKVTATVNLNKDESGVFLDVTLNAELKGVDQAQAEALVTKAHTICPYSRATRGNIEVKLQANGKALQETA